VLLKRIRFEIKQHRPTDLPRDIRNNNLAERQISFLLEPVLLIQVKFVPVPASFPSLTIYSDVLYSHGRLGQFTSGGGTGGFPDSGGGTHPFGQNGGEVEGVGSSGMPLRAGKMGPPPSTGSASREVQEPHP
jgi:hypothetical protein